jgi:hypothetical protein
MYYHHIWILNLRLMYLNLVRFLSEEDATRYVVFFKASDQGAYWANSPSPFLHPRNYAPFQITMLLFR